ncbi:SH3 domain-containing protein [Streptomyces sp. 21So2-11]|uniref:SH3 domain-containing protein n=1 Tax=Streptomyces sp. 21So2-11 TaxID=3144408 RepID=UPI00321A92B9
MPVQTRPSTLRRLGLYAATGAVAVLTAAGPALAVAEDPARPQTENAASHMTYKGRVTAKTGLLLRDRPTRSSRIIGSKPYGAIVHIFCKTSGQYVNGNSRWYLLTNGTWAWASAAYIANIGPAPRWC